MKLYSVNKRGCRKPFRVGKKFKIIFMKQAATNGTVYKLNFDFTVASQTAVLTELQNAGYKLLGYKGASGPGQVSAGVPVWFAEPFHDMFGIVEIDYQPLYKIYVFNEANIGVNTTIQMQALSIPIGLGTELVFNQNGTFKAGSSTVSPGSIMLTNNTDAGSNDLTIGLAALVNGEYLPFCAFTSSPQDSIEMTPHETVCLFAAQTSLVSGSVTAQAAAPGCSFPLSANDQVNYNLAIADSTYQVISAPGGNLVTPVSSDAALSNYLNG
jgi:hypothetical protein